MACVYTSYHRSDLSDHHLCRTADDGKRLTSDIYGKEKIKDPQTAAEPVTLGDDEYFVMGDNRNHSMDSRDPGVGVLTRKDLIGRAWVRIYPFDNIGVIRHE